jgi:AI-2 transport protein TqsA
MDDRRTPAPQEHGARPLAPKSLLGFQVTVMVILVGWALHATAAVSALVAAAAFVAIVLAPLSREVAARTGGRAWIGHLVSLAAVLVVLLTFAAGLLFAARRIATEFPALSELPAGRIPGVSAGGEDAQASDDASQAGSESGLGDIGVTAGELASRLADLAGGAAVTGLSFATSALGGVVLVILLALLMLVDAPNWKRRIGHVAGDRRRDATLEAVTVIGQKVRRFVVIRAGLGLLTSSIYMAWLWLFGVELILVWGILTFLLSFVPNLGSILSGILPTLYAFLTKDLGTAVAVGVGLVVTEQVIGNFIGPRIQGAEISISPTVVLVGLLAFAWIWGVPGTLLSSPVLIAALVIFSKVDGLRPVALLMSECDDYDELDEMVSP